jgi:hypothetical protein
MTNSRQLVFNPYSFQYPGKEEVSVCERFPWKKGQKSTRGVGNTPSKRI